MTVIAMNPAYYFPVMDAKGRVSIMCKTYDVSAYKRRVEEAIRAGRAMTPEFVAAIDKWLSAPQFKVGMRVRRWSDGKYGSVLAVAGRSLWVQWDSLYPVPITCKDEDVEPSA